MIRETGSRLLFSKPERQIYLVFVYLIWTLNENYLRYRPIFHMVTLNEEILQHQPNWSQHWIRRSCGVRKRQWDVQPQLQLH